MVDAREKAAVVVTSINPPTSGVKKIAAMCQDRGWEFIVVGDKKSPVDYYFPGLKFVSAASQSTLDYEIAKKLPYNSYSRKMLGYLIAASSGVDYVVETDDDNIPYDNFLDLPKSRVKARFDASSKGWINCYKYFTSDNIWPRGYPLSQVQNSISKIVDLKITTILEGKYIQQALADGDPDVDAVYRLVVQNENRIKFHDNEPLLIMHGQISPFNSQATTWPIELLGLMYLPVTCSFRMTDIWRSFICQKILKHLDFDLIVIGPRLEQIRNDHDLMKDFSDEIEGYIGYDLFVSKLDEIKIHGTFESILPDLLLIYSHLIEANFFKASEITYLTAWMQDVSAIYLLKAHE